MNKSWTRARLTEAVFKVIMITAFALVAASLAWILFTVVSKGLPSLTLQMLTQTPKGGYYLGKEGGILNAIVGSLYLAGGATLLALVFALPMAFGVSAFSRRSRWGTLTRLSLNVMWGVPTIVIGAFGFVLMRALEMRASLLAGIIVLALIELPLITLTIDEFIRMTPVEVSQAALAVGATRLEVTVTVILRQIIPGLITAILLAFGRAIGDAASVLFTAGYTDRIPDSLFSPAASLPLAVFFQLNTPYPEVQQRAYAAALVLTIIILLLSLGSRWFAHRLGRYVVR